MIHKLPGIYEIRCTPSGKVYIGQTMNLNRRQQKHWSTLRRGMHPNRHLQNAWLKYGETAFCFRTLLVCEIAALDLYEVALIARVPVAQRFNFRAGGAGVARTSRLGHGVSPETRQKIASTLTGRTRPVEHVRNAAEATKRWLRVTFPDGTIEYRKGMYETALILGVHPHSIQNSIKQKRPVCGGYLFEKIPGPPQ